MYLNSQQHMQSHRCDATDRSRLLNNKSAWRAPTGGRIKHVEGGQAPHMLGLKNKQTNINVEI